MFTTIEVPIWILALALLAVLAMLVALRLEVGEWRRKLAAKRIAVADREEANARLLTRIRVLEQEKQEAQTRFFLAIRAVGRRIYVPKRLVEEHKRGRVPSFGQVHIDGGVLYTATYAGEESPSLLPPKDGEQ